MRKDDKIIVTGSDGLLGSAIVRELKNKISHLFLKSMKIL